MGGRDCLEMNCWKRESIDGDSSLLTSSITFFLSRFFYRAPKEVATAALYAHKVVPSHQESTLSMLRQTQCRLLG